MKSVMQMSLQCMNILIIYLSIHLAILLTLAKQTIHVHLTLKRKIGPCVCTFAYVCIAVVITHIRIFVAKSLKKTPTIIKCGLTRWLHRRITSRLTGRLTSGLSRRLVAGLPRWLSTGLPRRIKRNLKHPHMPGI